LCLPEEYESARKCFTSIGWSDPRTTEGELLWPEKFPVPVLDKLKQTLGSMDYAAQYQQNPVPAGGAVFKEKWFRYLSIDGDQYALETPEGVRHVAIKDCWRFTVVDLAVSTKQSADYTVIQTYDVTPQNELLLIDQIRGHFDNPEQQKLIRLTYFRLKPQFVQIEAIAYQLALIQQLRDEPIDPASLVPSPIKVGDILVRTNNVAALDQTLQLLDVPTMKAAVVKDKQGNYAMDGGYSVVRVQGDFYFFKYACEQQGYCTIVRDVQDDDIKRIEQENKRKYSIPIKEYRPVRDKVSRASAPAILMENGKVYFLKTLQDLHIIRTEHLLFPKGGNDDIVDCSGQAAEVVTVPRGPMMWSIDDPVEVRSPETIPLQGGAVPSMFEHHLDDFEDEGELFDFEIGGGRW
jgi:phage terminase large subunit-like protein